MEWNKVPSVTPGGKPYFWTRRVGKLQQWIVFDRILKTWCLQYGDAETYHNTEDDAKKQADEPIVEQPNTK